MGGGAAFPPSGLAENGDILRIPAEGGDIALHPFHSGALIQQAEIGAGFIPSRRGELRVGEEAEHVHSIVDAH